MNLEHIKSNAIRKTLEHYVHIAVPRFLSHTLVYRFQQPLKAGTIVNVPIKQQAVWGLVTKTSEDHEIAHLAKEKIRTIEDPKIHPVCLTPDFLNFLTILSRYYHYPLGLIFRMACPTPVLRKVRFEDSLATQDTDAQLQVLTQDQNNIFKQIQCNIDDGNNKHLIYGVTGSGKTEVYMHLAQSWLERNKQVLMVVPEISLTPQFVQRFQKHLPYPIFVLHSELTPATLAKNWYQAYQHPACLVIGTRSALFHPLSNLGIILMDEEHDRSYKQNDHMRYHGREVALFRTNQCHLPFVSGSATPSFELLHLVQQNQVQLHQLKHRYGNIQLPKINMIQTPNKPIEEGWLSPVLKDEIANALAQKQQAMLYLNRKGYAPHLICTACHTWLQCPNCAVTVTYYKKRSRCQCHFCGTSFQVPKKCPSCHSPFMVYAGVGTEALEEALKKHFPEACIERIDRDQITTHKQLSDVLKRIINGEVDIMIGTQMLGKGHDFQKLKVLGMLEMDQTLHFPDFRSVEWTLQAIHQVAGRAGRSQAGAVFLQSRQPDHPLLLEVVEQDYLTVFSNEIEKRKVHKLPPFWSFARFVYEAPSLEKGSQWLQPLNLLLQAQSRVDDVIYYPPTPCLVEKIAKSYRIQILLKAKTHKNLHHWVDIIQNWNQKHYSRRYLLDINPQQFL